MGTTQAGIELKMKNILYLTDFSEPSEEALPVAVAIARSYGATVHALHILTPAIPASCPEAIKADDELAEIEMQKVESQLAGVDHDTRVAPTMEVWPAIEQAIAKQNIDLIVLGTHGRTGAQKLLMGSVAEEIFRRSSVPVLTIGPDVRPGTCGPRFQRVLFATNFKTHSLSAASYALSLAHENQSRLVLLHVMGKRQAGEAADDSRFEMSVAEAIHQLYETVPKSAEMGISPEVAVEFGEPAERIIEAARERGADLIVMGVHDAAGHIGAATHLERAVAHKVVAHAPCPVLTVRG
jgi:nucleotide-binding universal stress UspA family protein